MSDIDNEQTENLASTSWGPWQSANSAYKIKYRTRRDDDLGNGNFAWMIAISYDEKQKTL